MRLARPVYEFLPLVYAAIGGIGIMLAYVDQRSPQSGIALFIGLLAEIAALTVFLRRQDYRELSREYSSQNFDAPSGSNG